MALKLQLSPEEYNKHLDHLRDVAKTQGVDYILHKHKADVIIGPADSFLSRIAAGAGQGHFLFPQKPPS